ncbi:hypothetical protein ACFX1R_011459 [Malus domestica]
MDAYSTKSPLAARRNPITAPERKAVMKAFPTPLLASRVVLALAYVAIFIPRNPERTDVKAPSKKATVLKKALASAGLHMLPVLYVQGSLLVLKPFTEPRKRKMMALKTPTKMLRYLYWVNRKEVAPRNIIRIKS